jgi:hypothetical protein
MDRNDDVDVEDGDVDCRARLRAFAALADLAMSGYVMTVAMHPPIDPARACTYAGSSAWAML